ncbi:hypothetical protein PSAC2689_30374 [Paraburkholderia sacchari]
MFDFPGVLLLEFWFAYFQPCSEARRGIPGEIRPGFEVVSHPYVSALLFRPFLAWET